MPGGIRVFKPPPETREALRTRAGEPHGVDVRGDNPDPFTAMQLLCRMTGV